MKTLLLQGRCKVKAIMKKRGSGSRLEEQKKKYGWTAKDGSDEEFTSWWSRNHGSGYIDRARSFLLEKQM